MKLLYIIGLLVLGFALGLSFQKRLGLKIGKWLKENYHLLTSIKKYKLNWFNIIVVVLSLFIVVVTIQFIRASEWPSWDINPGLWAKFGTFIGAFLLAATLLYQARAFRKQQIEAKFFEMVKYYRDNVSELKFRNPFFYKASERDFEEEFVEGRRVFVIIFKQLLKSMEIIKRAKANSKHLKDVGKYKSFRNKVVTISEEGNHIIPGEKEWLNKMVQIEISYLSIFFGVCTEGKGNLMNSLGKNYKIKSDNSDIEGSKALKDLSTMSANYENDISIDKAKPIKFLGGHQYHLGHFFRHLFQTVKYIDNQKPWLLNKNQKRDYIKMLRAQMSNYEQALFFINSISRLGRAWEYDNEDGKKLITDYELIKNIPLHFIPDINPKDYYPGIKFEFERE